VPGNIPAATIRIDTIAGIPIGITKGVVLDEQELFTSKIRCIRPRSITVGVPSPSIVEHLKSKRSWSFVQNAMVDNPINLAVRHDKRIGVQLIKMAVVDPRRRTRPLKVDSTIVSI
jgi:hypothetical protein